MSSRAWENIDISKFKLLDSYSYEYNTLIKTTQDILLLKELLTKLLLKIDAVMCNDDILLKNNRKKLVNRILKKLDELEKKYSNL